jgi:hypothetical protein
MLFMSRKSDRQSLEFILLMCNHIEEYIFSYSEPEISQRECTAQELGQTVSLTRQKLRFQKK